MCGISGAWNRSGKIINKQDFVKFHNTLDHRGPNASGVHDSLDSSIYLGSKRLSILDLSAAGKQPMISKSGRYVIIFNGEIYLFVPKEARCLQLARRQKES